MAGAQSEISAATAQFLQEVFPAAVGTKRPNGSVHVNPAWFEYRDDRFWLNSWRGSKWLDNVEREVEATLMLIDPGNMFRTAETRTKLVRSSSDGTGEHIDRLSMRYTGGPYRWPGGPQERVMIELEPLWIRSSLDWIPPSRGGDDPD